MSHQPWFAKGAGAKWEASFGKLLLGWSPLYRSAQPLSKTLGLDQKPPAKPWLALLGSR
jgi:hypothetical protein